MNKKDDLAAVLAKAGLSDLLESFMKEKVRHNDLPW